MYVGVEMGGTKVIVAAGTGPQDLSSPVRIPTLDPEATMAQVADHIRSLTRQGTVQGIGIASFGPVGVIPGKPDYGRILRTPKPGWEGFDVLGAIRHHLKDTPTIIDTDVNGAAIGEQRWGGGQGLSDFVYVTVGTGIGVGIISGGKPVHGLLHPEAGHILVRHDHHADPYKGHCPFHGDCLEGLASGPAIHERTGISGEDLPDDHPAWPLVGGYLAQLYANLTLVCSPQRILVGGGVGLNPAVLEASRSNLTRILAGYIDALSNPAVLVDYIQRAHLGEHAGVLGAIALAERAAKTG